VVAGGFVSFASLDAVYFCVGILIRVGHSVCTSPPTATRITPTIKTCPIEQPANTGMRDIVESVCVRTATGKDEVCHTDGAPARLHGRLAREAEREGVSLNQWIVSRLAG
jgi:hypothetical protein